MNKNFSVATIIFVFVFCSINVSAQTDTLKKNLTYRIGIFAPLYLDSVFSDNNLKYKQSMPRFITSALEFVQGAQIALDSMPVGNENIEATIYDSKSYTQTVQWLIQNKKLDHLNLIIGSVKDAEFKQLAAFALKNKIPFISATYPNDGGITANPFLVIVNSTLKSHCDAIYSYILQNHGTDKIYLCRPKGSQEDMVASYFKQNNEQDGKPLLNIQTLLIDSFPTKEYLKTKLDSNRQSLIIGGSLEENFSTKLAMVCASLNSVYPLTLVGMPNWDGFAALHKKDGLDNFPIYYTASFYNSKQDDNSRMVTNAYDKKYKGKPADMAFKGFEMINLFTKVLIKYPGDFMNHINDKLFKVFNDYNFRPVMLKKESLTADYFENKHLYFIKILNGVVSKAW